MKFHVKRSDLSTYPQRQSIASGSTNEARTPDEMQATDTLDTIGGVIRCAVRRMHRLCRAVSDDDMTQAAWVAALTALPKRDPDRPLEPYVWTVVNRAIRREIHGSYRADRTFVPVDDHVSGGGCTPEEIAMARQAHEIVFHELARYAARPYFQRNRDAIVRTFGLDGKPPREVGEVAEELGVPASTVAASVYKATKNVMDTKRVRALVA